MKHTQGKLKLGRNRVDDLNQFRIVGDDGFSVFGVVHRAGIYRDTDDPARDARTQRAEGQPEAWANARRLVACWNACDGMNTETLENIVLLGDTFSTRFADRNKAAAEAEREVAALKAQRDELLGALECLLVGACAVAVPHAGERAVLQEAVGIARAAVTKHSKEASHG